MFTCRGRVVDPESGEIILEKGQEYGQDEVDEIAGRLRSIIISLRGRKLDALADGLWCSIAEAQGVKWDPARGFV
jgi:hypothetical protein